MDFLESILSITRRFIKPRHKVYRIIISSLINHLFNDYYIQIDRSITLIFVVYISETQSVSARILKISQIRGEIRLFPSIVAIRPRRNGVFLFTRGSTSQGFHQAASASRVSLFPTPEKRDRGIEKVVARYTLLPQLPAPRPKGFKSTGYLNDPRIYTLINHAFQVVFEKIVENSVLQEEEEF